LQSSKNPEGKYQLVDPDSDGEIRPDVHPDISVAKTLTTLDCINIGTERFQLSRPEKLLYMVLHF
jgi:hypothetical protein